jgi:hypothetical protein
MIKIAVSLVCATLVYTNGFMRDGFASQREIRRRPPSFINCPRDRHHLTSYTGVVIRYERTSDGTSLRIRTDWDTDEDVAIAHKGTTDPSKWFLYQGKPFRPEDWKKIELAVGRLRPGIRASAWVCDNGSNPIVDWEAPPEK